jgi:HK97 family phage major capsid protein
MSKTLTLQELRVKKQELAAEIRKQSSAYEERRKAGGEAWPDETREAWASVNKEYDANEQALIGATNDDEIRSRVEQIRKDEEQSRRSGPKPGLDDRLPGEDRSYGDAGFDRDEAQEYAQRQKDKRLVFRSWMLAGAAAENPNVLTDEMRDACARRKFSPNQGQITVGLHDTRSLRVMQRQMARMTPDERQLAFESGEIRALSLGTATAGPELVPQTFINILEMAMLAYGDMLSYVDTITTESGEQMHWPIADDTANSGHWVAVEGEDTQTIGEPNPAFRRQNWVAHELHSKWIKVPIALNEDSMFDLEVILAGMLGERLGRTINTAATTGDATGKPSGIMLDAPVGHTTASATAIAYDDVVKLEHSVDPSYRSESQFMLHDTILQYLRLLKDLEGRPLWQVSMRDGTPDRLHNRPYVYNQAMASAVTTGLKTMAFGRLRDYKLRRVKGVRIVRANERFIEKLQIGFLGYIRVDGKLLRPTADARCSVKVMEQD